MNLPTARHCLEKAAELADKAEQFLALPERAAAYADVSRAYSALAGELATVETFLNPAIRQEQWEADTGQVSPVAAVPDEQAWGEDQDAELP